MQIKHMACGSGPSGVCNGASGSELPAFIHRKQMRIRVGAHALNARPPSSLQSSTEPNWHTKNGICLASYPSQSVSIFNQSVRSSAAAAAAAAAMMAVDL